MISSAEGQGGSGGRVQALEDLNGDKQSLVGLTAADAFQKEIDLAGAELDNANLRGTTLGGADLREASLKNADLRDVVLGVSASDPLERSSRTRPTGHYPNVHRSSQKGCSRKSAGVRRMNRGRFSLPAEVVANTQKGVVGSGHPKRG